MLLLMLFIQFFDFRLTLDCKGFYFDVGKFLVVVIEKFTEDWEKTESLWDGRWPWSMGVNIAQHSLFFPKEFSLLCLGVCCVGR